MGVSIWIYVFGFSQCNGLIISLELDKMETEAKEESFEDGSIKSETFGIKTEFKAEVKEETFEEFDAHEQIGMDFITSKDFDTSIQSPVKTEDKTEVKTEVKVEVKTEVKAEVKDEAFAEFNAHEQIGMAFITSKDFKNKTEVKPPKTEVNPKVKTEFKKEAQTEVKTENFEEFAMCEQAVIDLITSKDY